VSDYVYVGSELQLFAAASRWKAYLRRQIGPYLGRDVLEVGAGIGATTRVLCREDHDRWVCLEPDQTLCARLVPAIEAGEFPRFCHPVIGTLDDVKELGLFDTLLYIDVLEHIEHDREELVKASGRLRPGGHLVVLSPAHPFLFSPFDRAIGHFRRYTRKSLVALEPPDLEIAKIRYLDSVGIIASLGNRLVLSQSMPTPRQIAFWDRFLVPPSTLLDPILGYRIGKSVLGVWRKPL
jgi:SAM-dependent methyltransferase